MKKVLVLMMILVMAGMANAALKISVDGVTDVPDTQVNLLPNGTASIGIWGDGTSPFGEFFLGISLGDPGSLNIDSAVILYEGTEAVIDMFDDPEIAEFLGVDNPFVAMGLGDAPAPEDPKKPLGPGTLINGIIFQCLGLGDVTLTLFNGDGEYLDSQIIHQVPEPMTISLLGLGGLLLRRRK